jgi:hypothetical protein
MDPRDSRLLGERGEAWLGWSLFFEPLTFYGVTQDVHLADGLVCPEWATGIVSQVQESTIAS